MNEGGIPELGISSERAVELMELNREVRSRVASLYDFILGLERLEGVTVREKLVMIAAMAHITILETKKTCTRLPEFIFFQGMN